MWTKEFDTNVFFSGGAGMFIQYHDIVKPVYLFAVIKMIITDQSFGLPINIISNMSIMSLIEWYIKRRYINPFKSLDYNHHLTDEQLDSMLYDYLIHDSSIYDISYPLNIQKMLSVYKNQHMTFPVYIYSEREEPYIKDDCKNIFSGIPVTYLFGDLESCIKKCDQNFTYIFSNIELVKKSAEILKGSYAHILLSDEYRYNYVDSCKTFKYDLKEIMGSNPYTRIGTTFAVDFDRLGISISKLFGV